jgi:HAD superfamily hydrolase (TIGR01509 family)
MHCIGLAFLRFPGGGMTPFHPIRAVVLDMDGLMLDTEGMSYIGWVRTFAERGRIFGMDRFLELVGLNVADARRKMLGWYGPEFPFDEVYARKMVHVDEIIAREGISRKPGLLEFLAAADSLGLAKAVATSTARERAMYKLKKSGLEERFDAFACGDEISRGKPAPDIFLLAARLLHLPPEECLALEDSDAGVMAAQSAGMRVVVIPDVKPPSPEASAAAWQFLPSLTDAARELPKWVR